MAEENEHAKELTQFLCENATAEFLDSIRSLSSAPSIVCMALAKSQTGLVPSQLAEVANCRPSRVTAILDDLEGKGCIERFKKEGDRLHSYVRLSAAGRNKIQQGLDDAYAWICGAMNYIGDQCAEQFVKTIKKLAEYAAKKERE